MTEKQRKELESVKRLFRALGMQGVPITCSDRPDNHALVNNQRIGIEVAYLHPDDTFATDGSRLRVEEKKKKQAAAGGSYFMWVPTDFLPAFHLRVSDKIQKAKTYSASDCVELWLLIACQLPDAPASTYQFHPFLDLGELNRFSHELLSQSCYRRAYLHLQLDDALLEWSPSERWRARVNPTGQSPTDDLWFKNLDEEWFRDPDGKMAEEIHKVIEEFRQNKAP